MNGTNTAGFSRRYFNFSTVTITLEHCRHHRLKPVVSPTEAAGIEGSKRDIARIYSSGFTSFGGIGIK
jgi:hypothetical protein